MSPNSLCVTEIGFPEKGVIIRAADRRTGSIDGIDSCFPYVKRDENRMHHRVRDRALFRKSSFHTSLNDSGCQSQLLTVTLRITSSHGRFKSFMITDGVPSAVGTLIPC